MIKSSAKFSHKISKNATLVDGESITDGSELNKLMLLQLLECNKLEDSYIQLNYKVIK